MQTWKRRSGWCSRLRQFAVGAAICGGGLLWGVFSEKVPPVVASAWTQDMHAPCEPHQTTLHLIVRLPDGRDVPGFVFHVPYPVCAGTTSVRGGTVAVRSSGNAFTAVPFPYVTCSPAGVMKCRSMGMDWGDIEVVRESFPVMDRNASWEGMEWLVNNGFDPRTLVVNGAFFEERDRDDWFNSPVAVYTASLVLEVDPLPVATPTTPSPSAPLPSSTATAPPAAAAPQAPASTTAANSNAAAEANDAEGDVQHNIEDAFEWETAAEDSSLTTTATQQENLLPPAPSAPQTDAPPADILEVSATESSVTSEASTSAVGMWAAGLLGLAGSAAAIVWLRRPGRPRTR